MQCAKLWTCVIAVSTLFCASWGTAQESTPASSDEPSSEGAPPQVDPAQAEIAFRFSEEFFASLFRRRVDRTSPVSQCVLGAQVTGIARTQADVNMVFQPHPKEAQFYIVLTGYNVADTVGVSGPARVYTTTTTKFRAWKLIRFQGNQFVTTPAGIESQTWSQTRCIESTARVRFVNRIVRRAAANRVAETRNYTTALANRQAQRQLLRSLDESVDQAIEEANERLSIRQTLLARFGSLADLRYTLSTTERYLEIYVNIASDSDPRRPPLVDDWRQSPLEIWVHTYVEDELLPPILRDWAPRYRYFIERSAERLAEAIAPRDVEFNLQFTPQLDWVVMRFGDELMERVKGRIEQRRGRTGQ